MEKDFRLASKKFWQTVRRLREGKQGLAQAVFSRGGELLTQTEDIVGRWKEHFGELLNPAYTPSGEKAESESSGEAPPISLAEVTEVVKQFFSGKVPGVDEIRPEMLKALDIVGLAGLTRLFNVMWVVGGSTCGVADRGGGPHFQKGGPEGVLQLSRRSQCSVSPGKFIPRCWKGGSGRLSNLKFRRSNVASVLAVEQWTSSLPLQGCWGRGMGVIQSTCGSWTWRRLMAVSPGEYCGGYCWTQTPLHVGHES